MKFIELFCGIGGFRYGLEACNWQQQTDTTFSGCGDSFSNKEFQPKQSEKRGDYTCVWANDIDKYASAIYRYRFSNSNRELWEKSVRASKESLQPEGDCTNYQQCDGDGGGICPSSCIKRGDGWWHEPSKHYEGDIRTVAPATIPDHDLIVGGFPCQSFSIAGKRGGFEDTRGTLFFEICRIARAKRTKYLFLENVKGLLNHNQGKTFETIIRTLDELGYDCEWQVLNSKNYGVPQNRERVFIIANLRGERRFQVFPIREDTSRINEGTDETTVNTLSAGGHSGGMHSGMSLLFLGGVMGDKNKMRLEDGKDNSRNFPQGQRVYSPEGISAQLTAQGGGWGAKTGLYEIPETAQALQTDGQLRTGTSWGTNKPQSARSIRRLTPIECERLQGFPDNWTKYGIMNGKKVEISDSRRYCACGNAVTTNVIQVIGEKILRGYYGY